MDFFEKRIRPVLVERCYSCHSAKAEKLRGGLRLDSREGLLRGGESGPAILPGEPEKSLLIRAIRRDDEELEMPPPKEDRLSSEQVADFVAWVKMGAPNPRQGDLRGNQDDSPGGDVSLDLEAARRFWSFRPPVDPPLPEVRDREWPLTSVDRFILAGLEAKGLRPVEEADRRTLIRRVTFDLIGLPPSPEEVEAFLGDSSPDAFEKVVERLLASPHQGERWGRHWLDLVRYADTAGDNSDYPVPQLHLYRDYVIRSFNRDTPYDRFLEEQIAGDLLPASCEEERREKVVATGYLALSRRFGSQANDYPQHLTIEDTIDNLGRTVMGLSLGCARCHDHKYDPVPTEDYYALYGIFQSTRYPFPGIELDKAPRDLVPLLPAEEAERVLGPYREKLAELDGEVKRLQAENMAAKAAGKEPKREAIKEAVRRREEFAKGLPPIECAYAVAEAEKVGDARVHLRGEPKSPGEVVPRRFLSVLTALSAPEVAAGSGRRELARWLTDPRNPLTARVMVNRIWNHHFGRGLVRTPSDFGARGEPPTHPGLLDHLAVRFREGGWSVKAMHRLMVLSRTYRLSSLDGADLRAADPENDLRGRFERRRLEAEAIRDAMLSVSGGLDREPGGAHPFPPQKTWEFTQHKPFTAVYETRKRSVYLMTQRLKKHPFLEVFDGPDTNASTPVRGSSTTALQALYLLNDPFVHAEARRFAERLLAEREGEAARIERAYHLVFGRPPGAAEVEEARAYLARARERVALEKDRDLEAWSSLARVIFASSEFIHVD